jgi:hypothetical protein
MHIIVSLWQQHCNVYVKALKPCALAGFGPGIFWARGHGHYVTPPGYCGKMYLFSPESFFLIYFHINTVYLIPICKKSILIFWGNWPNHAVKKTTFRLISINNTTGGRMGYRTTHSWCSIKWGALFIVSVSSLEDCGFKYVHNCIHVLFNFILKMRVYKRKMHAELFLNISRRWC